MSFIKTSLQNLLLYLCACNYIYIYIYIVHEKYFKLESEEIIHPILKGMMILWVLNLHWMYIFNHRNSQYNTDNHKMQIRIVHFLNRNVTILSWIVVKTITQWVDDRLVINKME